MWHLAIASVSDNAVLMGLSQDVFSEGSFLSSADGYLWDDTLSEDDLEVVCGVFFNFNFNFLFLNQVYRPVGLAYDGHYTSNTGGRLRPHSPTAYCNSDGPLKVAPRCPGAVYKPALHPWVVWRVSA